MEPFDLDNSLIDFKSASGVTPWRIRDAIEGVQIFGGIGSGKTSGSGRLLALKYLANDFGGLVLTAKPGEKVEILMNVTTPFRRKLTTHSGRN